MPLTQDDILILKQPFGTLILDREITKERITSFLKDAKKVVSIGDATTYTLISFDITPDLSIIDGKERRSKNNIKRCIIDDNYNQCRVIKFRCRNRAGTISRDALSVLHDALRISEPVRIIVEGEEDMLALAIFAIVPDDSLVLYGQPLEGMVIVKIDNKVREKAKDLMSRVEFE